MKSPVLRSVVGLTLLVLLGGLFFLFFDRFQVNPLVGALAYEYPGFAVQDASGGTYLIDRSLKRIVKTSASGDLAWVIVGGSRTEGSFFFADELAVGSGGDLYVLNRVPDAPGFYTVLTQVLHFTAEGKFDRVVAEKRYGEGERVPTLVQRGQWHSLQAEGPRVSWFDSTPQGLVLYQGPGAGPITFQMVQAGPADLLVPSAALQPSGEVIAVSKQGRIEAVAADGSTRVLLDASGPGPGPTPWKVRSSQGHLYFTDLSRDGIAELKADGTAPVVAAAGGVVYSLSVGPSGVLGTAGDPGALFFDANGQPRPGPAEARFPLEARVLHWALWANLAAMAAIALALVRLVFIHGLKRRIPPFLRTVAGVVFLTGIVGVLVSVMILNNFSQRYSTEVLSKITQLVHLVPRIIDPDRLTAVTEPSQFGGPDYLALRSQLIATIYGQDQKENQGLYFAIHRVSDRGLTTFMYLNGDTTIRHPFSYLNDPEGPYQKALKGETVAQYALDAWGSWMYSTGPLTDRSGAIVGVFEMGGDLYSFTQENNRLIQSLLVNILTVLVIFLLVLVEVTFLQDQLRRRDLNRALAEQGVGPKRPDDEFHRVFLVRSVTGLYFVAASLTLMFLPLMMQGFGKDLGGLPPGVVSALPVSVRLFFFGLGTVAGGNLARTWGWRPVFLAGLGFSALGLGAGALAADPYTFLGASVAIGLGAGLAMIGMRALVNREAGEAQKATSYGHFYAGIIAGTNVGVIVGSALADLIGFANVFWLSLAVTAGTLVLVLRLFPQGEDPAAAEAPPALGIGRALGRFFSDPGIVRFSLLIVLPVYVASMVLYFFLPVFGEAHGVSNADIGRIFLLNGLVVVYLGPALSRWSQARLGRRRSLLVSSLAWTLALVPFLVTGDLTGLVITVVLMGMAEGMAAVAHNEHLLALPVSQEVGGDRAAGFFEVVAKVGETVAPLLIAVAMLLGSQWGVGLVAAFLGGALILFWLTDRSARRREAAL